LESKGLVHGRRVQVVVVVAALWVPALFSGNGTRARKFDRNSALFL